VVSLTPQMRFLSNNACPNSGPDWLFGDHCGSIESSMTSWGYCNACWVAERVPVSWQSRVDVAITEQMRALGVIA